MFMERAGASFITVRYSIAKAMGLVSTLHRNSDTRRAALASLCDTSEPEGSGHSDNVPVLNQTCRKRSVLIDRERFIQARHSCLEPVRSVGKVSVGELSLSGGPECLSLQDVILTDATKTEKSIEQRYLASKFQARTRIS